MAKAQDKNRTELDTIPEVDRRRRIYIKARLPDIVKELKQLLNERKELASMRKEAPAGDRKSLNLRSIYVTARLEALHAEQKALVAERKGLAQTK